jgi:competence protein ComEC
MKPSFVSTGFTTSFIVAIFGLHWWQQTSYPPAAWGIVLVIAITGIILLRRSRTTGATTIAVSIGIALAFLRVGATTHVTTAADIESHANGNVATIVGQIVEAPERQLLETRYVVSVESILAEKEWIPIKGKVLATDPFGWPPHFIGDTVSVRGKLSVPNPAIPGYTRYLALRDIRATMPRATLTTVPGRTTSHWHRFLRGLTAVRTFFEAGINRMQPEPHASLLAGLLTGNRSGLPADVTEEFRRSGISHIIAISGYNITIILSVMGGLLFFVPKRLRFWLLAIGIVLFTFFVGGGATVVRAAIMGILGLLALHAGRTTSMRLLILWTAFFMLLVKPAALTDDVSFQLSFLSIIGLSELSPWLSRILKFLPKQLSIREAFTATLAAQIATLPVTVLTFGSISLIAPVTNLLVAPLVPLAMLFGFIGTVLGMVFAPAGLAVSYFAWCFLEAIFLIAHALATIPWSSISI